MGESEHLETSRRTLIIRFILLFGIINMFAESGGIGDFLGPNPAYHSTSFVGCRKRDTSY